MSGSSQSRDEGRFASSVDDVGLIETVGEIMRAAGFDPDEYVSTRAFDAAKDDLGDFGHIPSARQISSRLRRPWQEIVAVARGVPGAPTPRGAVQAWGRAEENPNLDERNVVFALGLVARELDQDSLTPDEYDDGVRQLLHAARRDGRFHTLAPLLPTCAQIVRVADDWDVALVMAGLRPRPGVQLTEAGQERAAEVWRRAHGNPAQPTDSEAPAVPEAHGAPSEQQPALEPAAPPLTVARTRPGGSPRTHRAPLELAEAIVIFWRSQGGWPKKAGVLSAWAQMVNTSIQDPRRHDWGEVLREADRRITEINDGTWPGRTWITRGQLDPGAPVPDDLPVRLDRRVDDRAAIDGLKKWLRDDRRPGEKLTHGEYRRWQPGLHGAPSLSAINNPSGRFHRLLRVAQREIAEERRGL